MLKLQGNGGDSTHVILLMNTEMGGLSGLNSSVNIGPWQLTVGGNDRDADFGGTLVGAGSLVKTGAGLLTLSGDNEAYAGNVEINGGKLRLINHKALSNTTRLTLASGVMLEVGAAEDIGGLAGAGDVLLEAALGVGFNHQSTDFAGAMSGTGTFTKTGNGRMNLLGRNDFSGAVHVSGGVLGIGAATALGEGNVVTIDGAATLLVYAGKQRVGGLAGICVAKTEAIEPPISATRETKDAADCCCAHHQEINEMKFGTLFHSLTGALLLASTTSHALPIQYAGNRAGFEATLSSIITDDYSAPGYSSGDVANLGGFDRFTDAAMSAVLGETRYRATTFENMNIILTDLGRQFYCAGCNGTFELDFTGTSIGDPTGVFGVGFDIMIPTFFHALVTFGDNSTLAADLSAFAPGFWGITADQGIRTINFGMPGGLPLVIGDAFSFDNLTIGRQGERVDTEVPEPVSLALLGLGLGVARLAGRYRRPA